MCADDHQIYKIGKQSESVERTKEKTNWHPCGFAIRKKLQTNTKKYQILTIIPKADRKNMAIIMTYQLILMEMT